MQFRHPELLYALFLLLIPLIVHLFQLRKFKKVDFSNVAFLKNLEIQTRKSSRIKKWLILFTRMAALAMIVLAFAQPYRTSSDAATKEKETIIYLDNSFSMQARGASGKLFTQAVQELIKELPKTTTFTLFTNTHTYTETTIEELKNSLLQLDYSAQQLQPKAISLRAQKYFSDNRDTDKRFIAISDFQNQSEEQIAIPNASINYVQLKPIEAKNITIDTAYINPVNNGNLNLNVRLSSSRKGIDIPVSLHNKEQLLAKINASFNEELSTVISFELEKQIDLKATISIDDSAISYDNELYGAFNTKSPIRVLSINDGKSGFLGRIFNNEEFVYKAVAASNLDYSQFENYNLIVLNNMSNPTLALGNALRSFTANGGSLIILLNQQVDVSKTNDFLATLGNVRVSSLNTNKRLLTSINYDHPVYQGVFDKRIDNFQYPAVNNSYNLNASDAILSFEDGKPFLVSDQNVFVSASNFGLETTNFTNSPLIVPTLFNIALQGLSIPKFYYEIGKSNTYDISFTATNDQILHLEKSDEQSNSIIPLQNSFARKVRITTDRELSRAGIYKIKSKDSVLENVAYNYPRTESILSYTNFAKSDAYNYHTSLKDLMADFKEKDNVQTLWKWFVIFALFFLLLEMLILKFFK